MNPELIDLLNFVICLVGVAFLWGFVNLLVFMPDLWKYSVIGAMTFVGIGAIALIIPELRPYAGLIQSVGWTGMVVGAFFNSYLTLNQFVDLDPAQPPVASALKRTSMRTIVAGVAVLLLGTALLFSLRHGQTIDAEEEVSIRLINARLDSVEYRQHKLIANTNRLIKISTSDSLNTVRVLAAQQQSLSNQKRAIKTLNAEQQTINRVEGLIEKTDTPPTPTPPKAVPAPKKRFRIWPFSSRNQADTTTNVANN